MNCFRLSEGLATPSALSRGCHSNVEREGTDLDDLARELSVVLQADAVALPPIAAHNACASLNVVTAALLGVDVGYSVRRPTTGLAWRLHDRIALSMSASPGPNNAMVAASGATWGFQCTVPHMLGISVGLAAMVVAVALGAGELLRALPWLHSVLRWVGSAYLLWLA